MLGTKGTLRTWTFFTVAMVTSAKVLTLWENCISMKKEIMKLMGNSLMGHVSTQPQEKFLPSSVSGNQRL